MRPGRPKQHIHNWKLKAIKPSKWVNIEDVDEPGEWKKYSPGGFYMLRYWVCIRGNKVKHSKVFPTQKEWNGPYISEKRVFIAASGIPYTMQKQGE